MISYMSVKRSYMLYKISYMRYRCLNGHIRYMLYKIEILYAIKDILYKKKLRDLICYIIYISYIIL